MKANSAPPPQNPPRPGRPSNQKATPSTPVPPVPPPSVPVASNNARTATATGFPSCINWSALLDVITSCMNVLNKERFVGKKCDFCRVKAIETACQPWNTEAAQLATSFANAPHCNNMHHYSKSMKSKLTLLIRKHVKFCFVATTVQEQEGIVIDFIDLLDFFLAPYFASKNYQSLLPCANAPLVLILQVFLEQYDNVIAAHRLEDYKIYPHIYHGNRYCLPMIKSLLLLLKARWEQMTRQVEQTAAASEEQTAWLLSYATTMRSRITASLSLLEAIKTKWYTKEQDILLHAFPAHSPSASTRSLISSAKLNDLSNLLRNFSQKSPQVRKTMEDQCQQVVNDLKDSFQHLFVNRKMSMLFTLMGSRISGIGDSSSDVDIVISMFSSAPNSRDLHQRVPVVLSNKRFEDQQLPNDVLTTSKILKAFSNKIRYKSQFKQLFEAKELILHARVPVLKLVHIPTGIDVDLCVENQLGVQNTLLLRDVCERDPRAKALLTAIKYWAKERCVNQSSLGTISSFSWCLMVVHFLQSVAKPAILPMMRYTDVGRLYLQSYETSMKIDGKDVPLVFSCPEQEPMFVFPIEHEAKGEAAQSTNTNKKKSATIGELLLQFFAFYALDVSNHTFDFYEDKVFIRSKQDMILSVDDEAEIAESNAVDETQQCESSLSDWQESCRHVKRNFHIRKEWRMKVHDPFDDRNLARVVQEPFAQKFMQQELRRSFAMLLATLSSNTDNIGEGWKAIITPHEELPNKQFSFCTRCNQLGHNSDACTDLCHQCFQIGHLQSACTLLYCLKCNNVGHNTASCSAKKDDSDGEDEKSQQPQAVLPKAASENKKQRNKKPVAKQVVENELKPVAAVATTSTATATKSSTISLLDVAAATASKVNKSLSAPRKKKGSNALINSTQSVISSAASPAVITKSDHEVLKLGDQLKQTLSIQSTQAKTTKT